MPGLLLLAALFTFTDPTGDAHGDGSYVLPGRPPLNADALDLREFQAVPETGGLTFRVSLGAMQNPWNLPSGYSAGVTDIFVKSALGGVTTLTDLNLRVKSGWQYHVRVSGASTSLQQVQADGQTITELPRPEVAVEGTTLVIRTVIPPANYGYWVTNSLYSPFKPLGLVTPSNQADPGTLSAARANPAVPVDVLAPAEDYSAYSTGILAPVGQTRDARPWLLGGLALLGLVTAGMATFRRQRRA